MLIVRLVESSCSHKIGRVTWGREGGGCSIAEVVVIVMLVGVTSKLSPANV